MFFTWVGTIIAYIGFLLGVFRIGTGFYVAFNTADMSENILLAQRYLGASNTGEAINEGMYVILVSVALGTLCEISRKLNYS